MKFSINQSELQNALSVVLKGVATRSTLPILSGVFLEADNDSLTLQTTDLELSVQYTVAALVEQPGRAVVPGKLFADIGENQDIEGFKALHDTEKPMNPDQPDLGPISNQVVFLGGRGDGRTTIVTRFSSNFGTINQYGHGST